MLSGRRARPRGDDPAAAAVDRRRARRAAIPGRDSLRGGARSDHGPIRSRRLDFSGNRGGGRAQAPARPRLPLSERAVRAPAGAAECRTRTRSGAGPARGRVHPRIPAVGRPRRRLSRVVARADSAHHVGRPVDPRPPLSGDGASHRGDGRLRHLVPLRPIRGSGGRRGRRNPDGREEPADDGKRLRRRRARTPQRSAPRFRSAACDGPGPPGDVRDRRRVLRDRGGGAGARGFRRRHGTVAARRLRGGRRPVRDSVRHGRCADRRDRGRLVATDLRNHARDPARHRLGLRGARLDGSGRPRRRSHGRNDRRGRRVEGRGHLAGLEDRIPRGRDTGAPAARAADRRGVRVLGGRGHRDPARPGLHVWVERDPGAAGDADEDDHRGRSRRSAPVGSRPDGRRPRDFRDAVRRVGPGVCDRRLSSARFDGADLRRGLRPRLGRPAPRGKGSLPAGGDAGILAASGLVAGEGLAGVLVAGLVAAGVAPKGMAPRISGALGQSLTLLALAGVCGFLLAAGARRANKPDSPGLS